MFNLHKLTLIFTLILSLTVNIAQADPKITVFAAASLTNAITEIAQQYKNEHAINVQNSFASSSTLAKQIENGAPADIFISADTKWIQYLQDKQFVKAGSRVDLLKNNLVMIAPKGKAFEVKTTKDFKLAEAFNGRLCTGIVDAVPAGIYAKQSLIYLNWWNQIKSRIVGTEDVRAALAFVERGECAAGIVYETDAKISDKVSIIANLPEQSHEPIVYPLALMPNASDEAVAFYQYLKSPEANAVFEKFGFTPIKK